MKKSWQFCETSWGKKKNHNACGVCWAERGKRGQVNQGTGGINENCPFRDRKDDSSPTNILSTATRGKRLEMQHSRSYSKKTPFPNQGWGGAVFFGKWKKKEQFSKLKRKGGGGRPIGIFFRIGIRKT